MKNLITTILWLWFGFVPITNAQQIKNIEPNSFKPGWYVGANAGLNWEIAEGNFPTNHLIYFSLQTNSGFIFHAFTGYNFTSVTGIRWMVGYVNHNWPDIRFQTANNPFKLISYRSENTNVDFTVNLVNWWVGYNPKQVFDISVFGGLGLDHRDKASFSKDWLGVLGRVGTQSDFHILPKVDLNLIFEINMIRDDYNEYVRSFPLQSFPALTLGLTFK